MLDWLFRLLGAPILDKIVSAGLQYHADSLKAQNDARASEIEAAKAGWDAGIRDRTVTADLWKGLMGDWAFRLVWLLYAAPPGIYLAWLFIHDKLLQLGSTDPLSPFLEGITHTVVYALFGFGSVASGGAAAVKIASIVNRKG